MWGLIVIEFILALFLLVLAIPAIPQIKDPIDEADKKAGIIRLVVCTALSVGIILYCALYAIPQATYWDEHPVSTSSSSSSSSKVKCSWCGKKVDKDDMRGKWCKDCQNDAFGEDGWYNK